MPIPPELTSLPIIEATPWLEVDPREDMIIEGPAFDRNGNLFVTAPTHGNVYRTTPQKEIQQLFGQKEIVVDGSAFHKDGRFFVVCLSGEILVMDPINGDVRFLHPVTNGKTLVMNDIVFDPYGNMYITDFQGTVMDPIGGVYRISSDGKTVDTILQGLASPNGICLTPEGDALWVGETTRNTVIRIGLLDDGVTINPMDGVSLVYYSTGFAGPDSNKVDKDGHLYQCIMGQGRIVVLNKYGIPVANVVIPGHEEGKLLRTTNLAFKPDTKEGFITTSGTGGAWVYHFNGLSEGLTLFSHTD